MKDCGIVKDLLPLVAENMASEESAAFVKQHIETCEDCKNAFEEMKTPVEADAAAPLKTVMRAVKKRGWLIAGLIACLVAALLVGVFARLKKAIPLNSADVAFEWVEVSSGLRYEVQGSDLVFQNLEVDPETGDMYYLTDDGQRILLRDLTVYDPEDGYRWLETDGEKQLCKLILTADPSVDGIRIEGVDGQRFVTAYTTLWHEWFERDNGSIISEIPLYDVDVVYFEPFDNTEHEVLYQREGYTPEAGFALPRLVINYYFLMALAGMIVLASVWFVLRLLKKQKASRILGVLLLIAGCGVLAFLFAGFPATTIEPLRDLTFVCIIAVLLFGAGLCGRKLLRKE